MAKLVLFIGRGRGQKQFFNNLGPNVIRGPSTLESTFTHEEMLAL